VATPDVAVLVPWRSIGESHRERSWSLVQKQWASFGYPVYTGDDGGNPFSRAAAINNAASQAPNADVYIVADADVLVVREQVEKAIAMALEGPGYVQPFDTYIPLDAQDTYWVWQRQAVPHNLAHRPRATWVSVSACQVMSRQTFEAVGGFDERFRDWGYEDSAFDLRMTREQAPRRNVAGPAWHLFHPFTVRDTKANVGLWTEYMDQYQVKIPKILHRVVPEFTTPQVERWWELWCEMHPDWEHRTWRDPINPEGWETGQLWSRAVAGAQIAGYLRLEILWKYGGVYVDSDLEPVRPIDPLCNTNRAFAVREDDHCVPDFVLGAPPEHPAIRDCLDRVLSMPHEVMFDPVKGPWDSGPGVTNAIIAQREDLDCIVYPPVTFCPVHYKQKDQIAAREHIWRNDPKTYAIHHWHASWKEPQAQEQPA